MGLLDRRRRFYPRVEEIPWRRKCQPARVSLPGESHGWRNFVGYILHVVAESPTRLRDWTTLKHYVKKMLKYLQIMKENTESAKRFWRRCQSFLLWGDISQLRPLATVSSTLVCESVRNPELCPSPDSMFWYGGKSSVLDLLRPC